jgi:hypothetical protein
MVKKHFKMVTLREVIAAVQPGDWLISMDLKDAYFHVPIRPSQRKYLRFAFQGKVYQFKVLPFGATATPRLFTQVLVEVMALIRKGGDSYTPSWTTYYQETVRGIFPTGKEALS